MKKSIEPLEVNPCGWEIISSIAIELDLALSALQDYNLGANMPEEFAGVIRQIPLEWRPELEALFGKSGEIPPVLETLAWIGGVIAEEDYSRATLVMRDLTVEFAIERMQKEFAPYGIEMLTGLPLVERFIDFGVRARLALYRELDLPFGEITRKAGQIKGEFQRVAQTLEDGDLHNRFWFWVDRFYFQIYQPWRNSRQAYLEKQKKLAQEALGSSRADGRLPDISWLPALNPLQHRPALRALVKEGRARVLFFAEPFGMADLWSYCYPGWVLVSFATPGEIYENFQSFIQDIARRASALGDPTRLVILRLIRQFGMVNTEIAGYLGLARPTVSIHAKILREAGFIQSEQVGREMRHSIDPSEVRRLIRDLERLLDLPKE